MVSAGHSNSSGVSFLLLTSFYFLIFLLLDLNMQKNRKKIALTGISKFSFYSSEIMRINEIIEKVEIEQQCLIIINIATKPCYRY